MPAVGSRYQETDSKVFEDGLDDFMNVEVAVMFEIARLS
jgi:hypothetical protein